jgi:hypothetical protein
VHSIASSESIITSTQTPDLENEYVEFPWNKFLTFAKADHSKGNFSSWVWKYGYKVQEIKSTHVYWICKPCIRRKEHTPVKYQHTGGTANAIRHLQKAHSIGKDGPINKKRPLEEAFQREGESPMQAYINRRVESFNPIRFRTALIRWMAYNNVSFREVEGEPFRRMLLESNAQLEKANCLPSAWSTKAWILKDFNQYFMVIKQQLQSFNRHVHLTFDLWTAGNLLCLNGIFAHWLDSDGSKRKLLLSLPSINESHTGENIAKGIAEIIEAFGLEQRIGYFVLDNVTNCSTAVDVLADKYGFDATERRLRCVVHVLNLVAQQIMYGNDLSAFEEEGYNAVDLNKDLEHWRQRGVLGRLHNLIYWITDKHADGGRYRAFEKHQAEVSQFADQQSVGLKRPNDTRWNSHYYAFESAYANRAAIDDYCEQETRNYNRIIQQIRDHNNQG